MEPVRHCRFPGCSLARNALQHGSDATSAACTDSVLLRALTLHCAHHTFGATEESPSSVAKHPSTVETRGLHQLLFCVSERGREHFAVAIHYPVNAGVREEAVHDVRGMHRG